MKACNINRLISSPLTESSILEFNECVSKLGIDAMRSRCNKPEHSGMCADSSSASFCSANSVKNSFYASQIFEWLDMYREKLMVIKSEDFYSDTENVMNDVTDFLGIEPFDWSTLAHSAFNIVSKPSGQKPGVDLISTNSMGLFVGGMSSDSTSDYPPLAPEIREEFEEFFGPLNEALANLLNRPVFW